MCFSLLESSNTTRAKSSPSTWILPSSDIDSIQFLPLRLQGEGANVEVVAVLDLVGDVDDVSAVFILEALLLEAPRNILFKKSGAGGTTSWYLFSSRLASSFPQ